jgi:hypothetical protein
MDVLVISRTLSTKLTKKHKEHEGAFRGGYTLEKGLF